jgi:hypothetical protein
MRDTDLFVYVLDVMGSHLTIKDALNLACVSKSTQASIATFEEEIFSKHKHVQKIKTAVTIGNNVHCTHVTPECARITRSIPLLNGTTSKGILRAVLSYINIYKNDAVSVHIHLKKEHFKNISMGTMGSYTLKENMLFTTMRYSMKLLVSNQNSNLLLFQISLTYVFCFSKDMHYTPTYRMSLADLRPLSMDLFSARDWGDVYSPDEPNLGQHAPTDVEGIYTIPNLHAATVNINFDVVHVSASNAEDA